VFAGQPALPVRLAPESMPLRGTPNLFKVPSPGCLTLATAKPNR